MPLEPKLPTPQIDPEDPAEAILKAAEDPTRDAKVGGMATLNTAAAKLFPSLGDKMSPNRPTASSTTKPRAIRRARCTRRARRGVGAG
jgi:hypothetical protein